MMKRDIEKADGAVISGTLVDWGDALIPLFTPGDSFGNGGGY